MPHLRGSGGLSETPEVLRLLEKIKKAGKPLGEYVDGKFYRGILTGLNEAFVVDRADRDKLMAEDPSSADILKPFLRGKDVKRWQVNFAEQYLIKIESSINRKHSWSDKKENEAEEIFAKTYPAIYNHFKKFRKRLIKGDDQGKYFWELWSCKYWGEFEQAKIVYPNICKRNEFAWDEKGYYTNQKAFIIPKASKYLLGVLNSNVIMWLFNKLLAKLQNGYYEPSAIYIKEFPIPFSNNSDYIESRVNQILYAKNNNTNILTFKAEFQIDAHVAHLYNLTEEEYALILKEINCPDPFRVAALNVYRDIAREK